MDQFMDPTKTPSGMPPPGVTPNFIDPPNQASIATVFVTVTLALMIVMVAFRVHADIWISRKLESAGWASVVAMAASISYCAVFYLVISQHILGRHIWDVPISMNSNSSVQNFTVLNIVYGPAEFLAKLSVLMLYLRIFGVHRQTRILTYIAIAINMAQCLINIIGNAILCVPAPGQSWLLAAATSNCEVTADLLGVVTAAISIFNDFFIIIIPIPAVWSLQLATKRKIGVSAIFFTGLLVCVTSILNLVYRIRLWRSPEHDNTWNGVISYMLCAVEVNVAIICGCLPSLAAYLSRHRQFFSSLGSHIRLGSVSFRKHSNKSSKQSPSKGLIGAESPASTEEDTPYDPITLGSAVCYDGRFLKTVDGTQFVRSQDLGGPEHGPRSEEHHLEKTTLKQTTRNVYEMRSFPGGAVDDKDFTHHGAVV